MTARAVHWADPQDDYRSPCGADAGDDQVVFNHLYAYRVTCRTCKAARAAVRRRDSLTAASPMTSPMTGDALRGGMK